MPSEHDVSVRSYEQARENLAHANRIRSLRAALWQEWRQKGRTGAALEAAQLVAEPPIYLLSCRVELLLGRIPTIGLARPRRATDTYRRGRRLEEWMRRLGISAIATVGTLTPRQRRALCDDLRLYADPTGWTRHLERMRSGR